MIAAIVLAAAVSPEFELSVGPGVSLDPISPVSALALHGGVGVDLLEHLTLGASLLGIPGSEPNNSPGPPLFKAISGFASLRVHSSGDLQFFAEGGAGVGHLIVLSRNDTYYQESPPLRGGGGAALLLGGGLRYFVSRGVAAGVKLSWTEWTNVGHAGHVGTPEVSPESGLTVSAFLLLVSLTFAPGR
jgi:hypothetical protein